MIFFNWDKIVFSFFYNWSTHPIVATGFGLLTYLGDGLFALLVTVAIWAWERRRLKVPAQTARALFWTCLSSGILAQIIKHLVRRPRPLTHTPTSFPSGHTATAFAMAVVLTWRWPRLGWLFWLLATLVGISRIVLGQHYPLDTLAGALLGTLTAWGYLRWALRRRKDHTNPQPREE
ncbi:MAG: phosphatase PAP2 family protein [Firmicutes bacterium]|nr:phosphatase PAP2 family protein [Bacillota bacterium]